MKIKLSASLVVKDKYKEDMRSSMPTTTEVNKMLKATMDEALKDIDMFESWHVTGFIYDE